MFGIPDEYVPSLIALAGALFTGLVGLATGLRKSDSRRARLERDAALLAQIPPESAARTRLLETIDWQIGEIHEVDRHGRRDWLGATYAAVIVFGLGAYVRTTERADDVRWWEAVSATMACFLIVGFLFGIVGALEKKPSYARRNIIAETSMMLFRWIWPLSYDAENPPRGNSRNAAPQRGS